MSYLSVKVMVPVVPGDYYSIRVGVKAKEISISNCWILAVVKSGVERTVKGRHCF